MSTSPDRGDLASVNPAAYRDLNHAIERFGHVRAGNWVAPQLPELLTALGQVAYQANMIVAAIAAAAAGQLVTCTCEPGRQLTWSTTIGRWIHGDNESVWCRQDLPHPGDMLNVSVGQLGPVATPANLSDLEPSDARPGGRCHSPATA